MSIINRTAPRSALLRGSLNQRLRIGSGLVLFAFVLLHLLNHALGLWSITLMDRVQVWRLDVTRSVAGTTILAAALLVHVALNAAKIVRRKTWRMPAWEAAQIALGLLIPLLLLPHAVPMRGHYVFEGAPTRYSQTLPEMWTGAAILQTALIVVVWLHGCLGLHYWLRLAPTYRRLAPVLLSVAVLVPALAWSGFLVAGRQATAVEAQKTAQASARTAAGYPANPSGGPAFPTSAELRSDGLFAAWLFLGVVAGGIGLHGLAQRRHRRFVVSYSGGPTVQAREGPTLLEISRMAGVPHTSICGGRARCSTCRVRVDSEAAQPGPGTAEEATLARIGAAPDIRLACQFRPAGDVAVTRLVRPPQERKGVAPTLAEAAGEERTLAILFLDIRGFTGLSETRLPYDTVFLLNRFFTETGGAVTAAGGWIDKYMGDGMMALFGLNQPIEAACRAALQAAVGIDAALERLNGELADELAAPLRIGIGLHAGPLVIGRIGHRASAAATVIGPAVNVASRLESLSKEFGAQIVLSRTLADYAGVRLDAFTGETVTVRGSAEPLDVIPIGRGRDLEAALRRRAAA